MKNLLKIVALSSLMATPVLAEGLTFTITEMTQKDNGGKWGAVDYCTLHFLVENNMPWKVNLTLEMIAMYAEGSTSAMVAPSAGAFGRSDAIRVYGLETGASTTEKRALLGVICSDLAGMAIQPTCTNADQRAIDCTEPVRVSPNSVVGVLLTTDPEGTPMVGGSPAEMADMGALNGTWIINGDGDIPLFTIIVDHPIDHAPDGSYVSHGGLCEYIEQDAGCSAGNGSGGLRLMRVTGDLVELWINVSRDLHERFSFQWSADSKVGTITFDQGFQERPMSVSTAP